MIVDSHLNQDQLNIFSQGEIIRYDNLSEFLGVSIHDSKRVSKSNLTRSTNGLANRSDEALYDLIENLL